MSRLLEPITAMSSSILICLKCMCFVKRIVVIVIKIGSSAHLTLLDNMTVFVASGDCGAFDDETYVTFRSAFPPVIHGLWQLEAQIFRSIASSNVQMR